MADISIISRLIGSIQRNIDLQQNSLVVGSLKVGTTSPVELTKTILQNLVNLQNGSDFSTGTNAHTHDGRYFTETELGASSASSGSDLIGDDNTYTNFTPSAATVKGALAGIDSALATAGGTDFLDTLFRISDDDTPSKKIAFQASAITASTVRTISMPDANVNLADVNQALLQNGTRSLLANLDANGNKVTNLATATNAADAVRFDQLQNALAGLDFQPDINDVVLDGATTFPGTGLPAAALGQRYIIVDTSALDVAWGTITGVGNNDIVQYNGSSWVVAYDVSVQGEGALAWDRDSNTFQKWDGSSWAEFGGLAGITAGNGLTKSGNTLDLNFNEMSAVSIASGDELAFGDVSDANIVKKITLANFNAALDHDTLSGFVANEHIDHSTVSIATAADSGLSGGGDITTTRNLVVDIAGTTEATSVAGTDEVLASVGGNRRKVKVKNLLKNQQTIKTFLAGEAMAADTTWAVRIAVSGETAGRVYKADYDATSANNFYVIGVVQSAVAITAGDTVEVITQGEVAQMANDVAFDSTEIGQPVHLKAAGALDANGAITYVANQASFRFGYVQTTTSIFLDGSKQLNGVA
jgi:hypothetical protein